MAASDAIPGADGVFAWRIRSCECGPDAFATMPSICNLLQESAALHAEALGFSKGDFNRAGSDVTWVLTRLRVEMERLPRWEETVTVRTWPRAMRRIVAYRDFELFDAAGARLGAAASEWMIIDMATRKIRPLPPDLAHHDDSRPPALGPDPFATRLKFPAVAPSATAEFTARRHHLDLNRHVNNVHYVTWALATAPDEVAASSPCLGIDVTFRAEALAGAQVRGECVVEGEGRLVHRLVSPEGREHVVMTSRWGRSDGDFKG